MVNIDAQERFLRFEKLVALFEDQIVEQIDIEEKSF
jgi:hypothetical protein